MFIRALPVLRAFAKIYSTIAILPAALLGGVAIYVREYDFAIIFIGAALISSLVFVYLRRWPPFQF